MTSMSESLYQALVMYWILKTNPGAIDNVYGHAAAIRAAETRAVPAALIVSMAWAETRFQPNQLSVVTCPTKKSPKAACKRAHVKVRSNQRNPLWFRTSYFCGPMQATPKSWNHCRKMMVDLTEGYKAGVERLETWRVAVAPKKYCGKFAGRAFDACALRAYGGGWKMIPRVKNQYAWNTLQRMDALLDTKTPKKNTKNND